MTRNVRNEGQNWNLDKGMKNRNCIRNVPCDHLYLISCNRRSTQFGKNCCLFRFPYVFQICMYASRSATIYTRDDTSAQQFLLYKYICQTICFDHSSGHHQVSHRDYRITEGCAHILGSKLVFTIWPVSYIRGRKIK